MHLHTCCVNTSSLQVMLLYNNCTGKWPPYFFFCTFQYEQCIFPCMNSCNSQRRCVMSTSAPQSLSLNQNLSLHFCCLGATQMLLSLQALGFKSKIKCNKSLWNCSLFTRLSVQRSLMDKCMPRVAWMANCTKKRSLKLRPSRFQVWNN